MGDAEQLKANSKQLLGTLKEAVDSTSSHFSAEEKSLLKFHGIYEQDDRDLRLERMKNKQEAAWMLMVRTKIPGGHLTAEQYLSLDRLATLFANGTLRITTRQDIQFHGVRKCNVRTLIRGLDQIRMTTWGACGDVERNVVASPAPLDTPVHEEVQRTALEISNALLPKKNAYVQVWLNGEKLNLEKDEKPDSLYGTTYLPRKFKTGIAIPPRNEVDIFTHDLAYVAHFPNGQIEGYTVLAGGGLGMDHGKLATYPYLAKPLFYIKKEHAVAAAVAVLTMHREFGDRTNRKHARLKYVIEERGLEWFIRETKARLNAPTEDPKPFTFTTVADPLGWTDQGDGKSFLGVRVENGRIGDAGKSKFRKAFRLLCEKYKCTVRLTANQNIIFCGFNRSDRADLEKLLQDHGIALAETYTAARSMSMACVALPTCGLALSESERTFPGIMDQIDRVLKELGLEHDPILFRMTGCPNGCARPYNADFGFVGRGIGKYAVYIGGSVTGDRLAGMMFKSVAENELAQKIRPFLEEYVRDRQPNETFSAYWGRTHTNGPAAHSSQFHIEFEERAKRLAENKPENSGDITD